MWLRDSKTIFSEPWWVQEVLPDDEEEEDNDDLDHVDENDDVDDDDG